jgi:hypothetical protein
MEKRYHEQSQLEKMLRKSYVSSKSKAKKGESDGGEEDGQDEDDDATASLSDPTLFASARSSPWHTFLGAPRVRKMGHRVVVLPLEKLNTNEGHFDFGFGDVPAFRERRKRSEERERQRATAAALSFSKPAISAPVAPATSAVLAQAQNQSATVSESGPTRGVDEKREAVGESHGKEEEVQSALPLSPFLPAQFAFHAVGCTPKVGSVINALERRRSTFPPRGGPFDAYSVAVDEVLKPGGIADMVSLIRPRMSDSNAASGSTAAADPADSASLVSLTGSTLTDAGLEHIAGRLRHSPFSFLDLENARLTPSGAVLLCDSLAYDSCVVDTVRLSGCRDMLGERKVSSSSISSSSISSVSSGTLSCPGAGLPYLAASLLSSASPVLPPGRLKVLDLVWCGIGEEGARTIAQAIRTVSEEGASTGPGGGLQCIDLCGNSIGAEGVAALEEALVERCGAGVSAAVVLRRTMFEHVRIVTKKRAHVAMRLEAVDESSRQDCTVVGARGGELRLHVDPPHPLTHT